MLQLPPPPPFRLLLHLLVTAADADPANVPVVVWGMTQPVMLEVAKLLAEMISVAINDAIARTAAVDDEPPGGASAPPTPRAAF